MAASVAVPRTDVDVKQVPAQDYIGRRFVTSTSTVGRDVEHAFNLLYELIASAKAQPAGPPFLMASAPSEGKIEIEVGAPCTPVPEPTEGLHAGHLDGGRVASLLYRGPYELIGKAYEELFAWIGRNGSSPRGDAREVYLNGPGEVERPSDYLAEIVVPIR